MLFTFKRNEEGLEYIYVGDVRVAKCLPLCTQHDGEYEPIQDVPGVDGELIVDAIERADEAGFWAPVWEPIGSRNPRFNRTIVGSIEEGHRVSEVTVDVPVADNAVLIIETDGGDEA